MVTHRHRIKREKGLVRKYNWKSQESLDHARQVRKERIPWNAGKTGIYSEATLRLIRKGNTGKVGWSKGLHVFVGSDNGMFGREHRPETVEKLRIKRIEFWKRKKQTQQNRSKAMRASWKRRRRKHGS
jgi:hypothetical protein